MDDQVQDGSGFVFKVLSGSLYGIEFALDAQDYFIYVGDGQGESDSLAMAERTLQIPSSGAHNNFVIRLSLPDISDQFLVTICQNTDQDQRTLELNTVCEVEGVRFAIRFRDQRWSEQVLRGVPPAGTTTSMTQHSELERTKPDTPRQSGLGRWIRVALFILIMATAGVAVWKLSTGIDTDPAVVAADALHQLVGDRPGFSLYIGRDDINYLFAPDLDASQWVQQAILRANLSSHYRVLIPKLESARLSALLEQNNIAAFSVRLSDPRHPDVLLSSTRNRTDPANLTHIKKIVTAAAPYASEVNLTLYSDQQVLNKAQQGLKALGIEYQVLRGESAVTLSSWIPSADINLNEFSRFVSDFYRNWGQTYVKFSIDIHEDAMKGKSFKYSNEGAVTMSKSHWSFQKSHF